MNQIVRRKAGDFKGPKPEILAPAGQRDSFLAALAAGADAIYCGLKSFSARMAAKNFPPEELAALTALAHAEGVKVYLTVNTLIKPDELQPLGRQLDWINRHATPDGLIVQDLAAIALAKQVGFAGEIHLSTLANVTMPSMLPRLVKTLGVNRVVLPRELNVDEIKLMAAACPPRAGAGAVRARRPVLRRSGPLLLEQLSGRQERPARPLRAALPPAVQPRAPDKPLLLVPGSVSGCAGQGAGRIPQVRAWKIEGRKKGPHYVYYTVAAYKMLRDEGQDPQAKRSALGLLEMALGRPGTHYHFLPQRPQNPIDTSADSGSGLMVGTVRGGQEKPYLEPRMDLLEGDKLRLGYEDEEWHQTIDLSKGVPKGGKFFFKIAKGLGAGKATPVFLIDRREPYLAQQIEKFERRLQTIQIPPAEESNFNLRLPPASPRQPRPRLMQVLRQPGNRIRETSLAIWLSSETLSQVPDGVVAHAWWWLPPVIWPDEEAQWQQWIKQVMAKGAERFVLNAPWQVSLFPRPEKLSLWAGPFCNISNPMAVRAFKLLGGQGVIVSPELGQQDMEALAAKSVLPLGAVVSGQWPFCVSRVVADEIKPGQPFVSPKGEQGWVQRHGSLYWIFPNWPVNLRSAQEALVKAGYRLFVHLEEPIPKGVTIKKRPGNWNWELGLK